MTIMHVLIWCAELAGGFILAPTFCVCAWRVSPARLGFLASPAMAILSPCVGFWLVLALIVARVL